MSQHAPRPDASRWLALVESLRRRATPGRVCFYLGPLLLTWLGLFLYFNTVPGVLDRHQHVRGRDFLSFWVHGRILADGGGPALYDPEHFLRVQESVATADDDRPRYYPLYPPATALLFAPLASLPYETALYVWWAVLAGCFALGFAWLSRLAKPEPAWRWAFFVALGAFTPVFSTFINGQFSAVLLLLVLAGFELHHRGHAFWAGCVLSLLTLKPQLAAGTAVWLLLRGDVRTLAGLALGALVQTALVAAVLGTDVFVAFVHNMEVYVKLAKIQGNTADHQHALAGILTNLLGGAWADRSKLIHAVLSVAAVGLLWRVVAARRRAARAGRADEGRVEHAAALAYVLFATPHLLTYDLVLLLPAIAWLWAPLRGDRPGGRVGLAAVFYLAGAAPPVYHFTGFSLVPLALVGGLVALGAMARREELDTTT